jgi:non-ribosomal peptide synthetase component F
MPRRSIAYMSLYENATTMDHPREMCLHELFEAQVERIPGMVAVIYGERRLNYRELNERANRLAHYLRDGGVAPDTPVGLCLERSPEMIVGILGILKAGGAYVPLDPSYPQERLAYMIEDTALTTVLTQSSVRARVPTVNTPMLPVCLDAPVEMLRGYSTKNPKREEVGLTSRHLAYVIYTSGSTGKPKGVMVEHGGLANYVGHAVSSYLTEEIVGAVVSSPLSFDATVTTLLAPLAAGRQVELLPADETTLNRLAERLFSSGGEGAGKQPGAAGSGERRRARDEGEDGNEGAKKRPEERDGCSRSRRCTWRRWSMWSEDRKWGGRDTGW